MTALHAPASDFRARARRQEAAVGRFTERQVLDLLHARYLSVQVPRLDPEPMPIDARVCHLRAVQTTATRTATKGR